jgi:DNA polymerase III alpha subunit
MTAPLPADGAAVALAGTVTCVHVEINACGVPWAKVGLADEHYGGVDVHLYPHLYREVGDQVTEGDRLNVSGRVDWETTGHPDRIVIATAAAK